MNRKGPAQSGFDVKPFDYRAWMKEQRDKRRTYLEMERLRTQLVLPLCGISRMKICPECGCIEGRKCKNCNSTGFVQGFEEKNRDQCMLEEEASVPHMVECRRCWGVGKVATTTLVVKNCPTCGGSGRVEAQLE